MDQLGLAFGHDQDSLEKFLSGMTGREVSLIITDNSTSMLSVKSEAGGIRVRLHRIFLSAGDDVLREVAAFVKRRGGRTPLVREYIRKSRSLLTQGPERRQKIIHEGKHHNLLSLYHEINEEYFDGRVSAVITWGKQGRRHAYRRRTLGSYWRDSNTIRINPCLDRKTVPEYFIGFIVYHEMLHADLGHREKGGRRLIHSREFREQERLYRHYEKALRWEKTNL